MNNTENMLPAAGVCVCVYVPSRYGAVLEIHAQTASSNCDTFLLGPADKIESCRCRLAVGRVPNLPGYG